jgi:hypothetical protein
MASKPEALNLSQRLRYPAERPTSKEDFEVQRQFGMTTLWTCSAVRKFSKVMPPSIEVTDHLSSRRIRFERSVYEKTVSSNLMTRSQSDSS